jgi:hypothetical protein
LIWSCPFVWLSCGFPITLGRLLLVVNGRALEFVSSRASVPLEITVRLLPSADKIIIPVVVTFFWGPSDSIVFAVQRLRGRMRLS